MPKEENGGSKLSVFTKDDELTTFCEVYVNCISKSFCETYSEVTKQPLFKNKASIQCMFGKWDFTSLQTSSENSKTEKNLLADQESRWDLQKKAIHQILKQKF